MSASSSQVQFYPTPSKAEDVIDLRQVANALGRRRRLIAVVTVGRYSSVDLWQ